MHSVKEIEQLRQDIKDIISKHNKGDRTNFITSKKVLECLRNAKNVTKVIKDYLEDNKMSKLSEKYSQVELTETDVMFLMPFKNNETIIQETDDYIIYSNMSMELKPKVFIEAEATSFDQLQESPYFVQNLLIPLTAVIAHLIQNALRLPLFPCIDEDTYDYSKGLEKPYQYYFRRKTLLENGLNNDELVAIDMRVTTNYLIRLINIFELDGDKFNKMMSEYKKDKLAFAIKYSNNDVNFNSLHTETIN